ncbi:hypothetical protein AHF37_12061, partial [Paragonimus kellicotti]
MQLSAASFEEAWSHVSMVDLDESVRTVPMVAQSSPQKVLGNILNHTSSNSSNQDIQSLLLKIDMLEKLLRPTVGVDRSPNDYIKSLACLPFMAMYCTLTDFYTSEIILLWEEKRKPAALSTYTSLTVFTDVPFLQIHRNLFWGVSFEKFANVCSRTIFPK